jgi:hypothetical protein
MLATHDKKKTARALHRTAPDTTADCAVPPLFIKSIKPEMVAPATTISETTAIWPAQGMATQQYDR